MPKSKFGNCFSVGKGIRESNNTDYFKVYFKIHCFLISISLGYNGFDLSYIIFLTILNIELSRVINVKFQRKHMENLNPIIASWALTAQVRKKSKSEQKDGGPCQILIQYIRPRVL